jgi:hypothetical protein
MKAYETQIKDLDNQQERKMSEIMLKLCKTDTHFDPFIPGLTGEWMVDWDYPTIPDPHTLYDVFFSAGRSKHSAKCLAKKVMGA